jgi:F5/8 type C domain/Calcineurin-like phosphoesterase/Iron/zinc purple acid phosphatase-like protein C
LNTFKKSSCTVGNRSKTLKLSLFLKFPFIGIIIVVTSLFIHPFFLFGQSVPSTFSSDTPQKHCSPVNIQNITTSGSRSQYPASNVLDSNINTRWSNSQIGSWIQLDLGTSKNICSVDIAWHEGNERQNNFTVSTSNDSLKFSDSISSNSSGSTASFEKYNVTDINARYLRITVNGNTLNNYSSIGEIVVNEVSTLPMYSIGAVGDWGSARNDNWEKTVQLMVDNKVNLSLGLGDYSYGTVEEFQPVVDALRNASIPMKGAKGDHDSNSYAELFGQPSMVHAFDAGDARIIMLDAYRSPSSNAVFLEQELNATSKTWKIVVTTTPLYTSPSTHDVDEDQTNALQPLLDKYKVDLVMWGDNHNYERMKFPDKHAVFIQSGTAGRSHYEFDGQIAESVYQNDEDFGITKLTINNNTLAGQFISHDGRILDSFSIHR